jgi:toxin FitB
MPFLLDTCALSELVAKRRNPHAVEVILAIPQHDWFLSVATVGEIRRGIEQLDEGPRRHFLETWFQEHVVGLYEHKIIVFDIEEATAWGTLTATLRRKSLPMSIVDSLIAATAMVHGLTIVTRNAKHFAPSGVPILNPWE